MKIRHPNSSAFSLHDETVFLTFIRTFPTTCPCLPPHYPLKPTHAKARRGKEKSGSDRQVRRAFHRQRPSLQILLKLHTSTSINPLPDFRPDPKE